jgi:hypothetical protein
LIFLCLGANGSPLNDRMIAILSFTEEIRITLEIDEAKTPLHDAENCS